MLMSKKLKLKKGFTMIELVIVIAILAILAAIAIPVITTSINSAKIATMESNSATVEMLLKEAVNTSKAGMRVTYNNQMVTVASVEDVLRQNDINLEVMEVQKIGGVDYAIFWDSTLQGTLVHSGEALTAYDIQTLVADLE